MCGARAASDDRAGRKRREKWAWLSLALKCSFLQPGFGLVCGKAFDVYKGAQVDKSRRGLPSPFWEKGRGWESSARNHFYRRSVSGEWHSQTKNINLGRRATKPSPLPFPIGERVRRKAARDCSRTAFRWTVGIDLCAGCDLRKEGVTVNLSGRQSNNQIINSWG